MATHIPVKQRRKCLIIPGLITALVLLPAAMLYVIVSQSSSEADARRKRGSDAFAIKRAITIYRVEHNGKLPPSLSALEFEQPHVDVSPFRLLPPGSRTGKLNKDVLVEAYAEGNKGRKIVMYADGEVTWE